MNLSVWYAEASPSPEIGRKQTLLEDLKGWDKDLSFKSRRKWKASSLTCPLSSPGVRNAVSDSDSFPVTRKEID